MVLEQLLLQEFLQLPLFSSSFSFRIWEFQDFLFLGFSFILFFILHFLSFPLFLLFLFLHFEFSLFLFYSFDSFHHNIHVFLRNISCFKEFQPVFYLFLQFGSKNISCLFSETINSGGNRAFIGQKPRNSSFILGSSSTNKRRMKNQTIFRGISLLFQSSEQSL